jgi:hypothetical protein
MKKKFIISIIVAIAATLILAGIFKPSEEKQVLDAMIECYEITGRQCGLHNLLEEGDYEDQNIEMHRSWLESNELGLSEAELEKGKLIIDYMEKLSVANREALLERMYEIHIRRQLP